MNVLAEQKMSNVLFQKYFHVHYSWKIHTTFFGKSVKDIFEVLCEVER